MSGDVDRGCVHVWRAVAVTFRLPDQSGGGGSFTEYRCSRCREVLLVEPGGVHPG